MGRSVEKLSEHVEANFCQGALPSVGEVERMKKKKRFLVWAEEKKKGSALV